MYVLGIHTIYREQYNFFHAQESGQTAHYVITNDCHSLQ